MARGDWFRALQVPVLPVSAGAAIVGSLLGAAAGAAFNLAVFALVLASLVVIQVAANLQKGIVEASDLKISPKRPRSAFVFDAGAVGRTGLSPSSAGNLTMGLFAIGAALGLLVVLITGDLVLLVLGALGAFFAYSYSGPPLKLSYRGVGEVATFVAFGPLMVWGAYRAQVGGPLGLGLSLNGVLFLTWEALWVGLAYGALAAMISFSRYFPAEAEDRAKGKQTPVVVRGPERAARIYASFVAIAGGSFVLAWLHATPDVCYPFLSAPPPPRGALELLVAAAATVGIGALATEQFRKGDAAGIEAAVSRTVKLHLLVTIVVTLGVLATVRCGTLV
jgi:1,4-dihydroxy-2-naphthoate octaprenyltransferase